MAPSLSFFSLVLLGLASAQTPAKGFPEVHPMLETWKCTIKGGCVKQYTSIVLDQLAHPVHQVKEPSLGCGNWGSAPNVTVCPDEATCAKNCVVEGIKDYSKYGVSTKGDSLTLHQLLADGTEVSPRVYLLDEDGDKYEMLKLTGKEISFNADVSKLPCGMNGALYMSEMEETGGRSKLNPGGATYGAGYCDAQCFTLPFINGVGNIKGKGSCCNEMDLWEANALTNDLTPHTCNVTSLYECTGAECGFDGVCDQWGCGFNSYAEGNHDFYGPRKQVDTRYQFTVVTQFPADKNGVLQEIRRLYVQNGKIIHNAAVNITGMNATNSITDEYCLSQGTGTARFIAQGALEEMGQALHRGMVLVFSIWWDAGGFMNWLDTGNSGPCNTTEGDPAVIVKAEHSPLVTWSKIKWGEIGSTY